MTELTHPRLALLGAAAATAPEGAVPVLAEWAGRAEALSAFARTLPPTLPPITVYVTPVAPADRRGKIVPA